ncbi:MAG: YIP1 family protein [Thermodesulfobacteriota bacterium]
MNQFINRMLRAAKLESALYEEVEADKASMGQAMGVVILSSLASGIAMFSTQGFLGILIGTVSALAGWYIWAFLTYLIGTKLLPESQTRADHGELLRTIGFSSSPGIIRVVGIIPALNTIVSLAAGIWMLVAMVIAVRQALDYTSTFRAVGVCIIGWLIQMVVIIGIIALVGGFAAPA